MTLFLFIASTLWIVVHALSYWTSVSDPLYGITHKLNIPSWRGVVHILALAYFVSYLCGAFK